MTWVDREVAWNVLTVEYCDVTGQLLPRRYWSFEEGGVTLRTVHPRYETLYREYVLPRAASPAPGPAG